MSSLLDQNRLRLILERLSQEIRSDVTLYLTGGTLLIYHGIRPATTDIDFGFDATDSTEKREFRQSFDRFLRTLQEAK